MEERAVFLLRQFCSRVLVTSPWGFRSGIHSLSLHHLLLRAPRLPCSAGGGPVWTGPRPPALLQDKEGGPTGSLGGQTGAPVYGGWLRGSHTTPHAAG